MKWSYNRQNSAYIIVVALTQHTFGVYTDAYLFLSHNVKFDDQQTATNSCQIHTIPTRIKRICFLFMFSFWSPYNSLDLECHRYCLNIFWLLFSVGWSLISQNKRSLRLCVQTDGLISLWLRFNFEWIICEINFDHLFLFNFFLFTQKKIKHRLSFRCSIEISFVLV